MAIPDFFGRAPVPTIVVCSEIRYSTTIIQSNEVGITYVVTPTNWLWKYISNEDILLSICSVRQFYVDGLR